MPSKFNQDLRVAGKAPSPEESGRTVAHAIKTYTSPMQITKQGAKSLQMEVRNGCI